MPKTKKFPENVIPVNFNRKNPKNSNLRTLYPDAFAMYVDTDSEVPDKFSRAVLETLKKEADILAADSRDKQRGPALSGDDKEKK